MAERGYPALFEFIGAELRERIKGDMIVGETGCVFLKSEAFKPLPDFRPLGRVWIHEGEQQELFFFSNGEGDVINFRGCAGIENIDGALVRRVKLTDDGQDDRRFSIVA